PMVDCRETRNRYRADQLTVYALEAVGDDGSREPATDLLFAALGEQDEELIAPHRKRVAALEKRYPGRRLELVRMPNALFDEAARARTVAPGASEPGTLTAPRAFNLMFKTHVGALEDNSSIAYLRPETAQGI